ncbi:MAG: Ig-like domain-containing protein [Pelobacteraceae bacterium]
MKKIFPCILLLSFLVLTGCSGSNAGSDTAAKDQFAPAASTDSGSDTTPTPTGPGTVLSYSLTLNTVGVSGGGTTVGPGSTVVATAVLVDSNGNPVANQPIKFEKIDTLAPVTITSPIITTDSNGKSINFLLADNLPNTSSSSYDIIIKASTSVNGQLVTSVTIFKVVRSGGNVINFITSKSPTDPDGTLNTLAVTLKNVSPLSQPSTGIVQLVPFEVLDRNGIPMPRQPVAVSIYSTMGGTGCTAFIDSPELPAVRTVTTDDNGKGIFNAVVSMATPGVGSQNSCSIIYRATTTLAGLPDPPVFSYGGFIANVKNEPPQ